MISSLGRLTRVEMYECCIVNIDLIKMKNGLTFVWFSFPVFWVSYLIIFFFGWKRYYLKENSVVESSVQL